MIREVIVYEENRDYFRYPWPAKAGNTGNFKWLRLYIHAGDVNKPEILDKLRMMGSIYVVRGNNDKDWAEGIAKTLHFTIEGVKFFMTHNKKDVDWDLKDTQVVIFGHTHKYFEKMIDNRLWLNPGSCGPRRFDQEITMAVMTVDNGTYQWEKVAMIPEK